MYRLIFRLLFLAFCPLLGAQQTQTSNSGTAAPVSQPQAVLPQQSVPPQPRVFITDSQSWEVEGSAGGANGAFAAIREVEHALKQRKLSRLLANVAPM